MGCAGIIERTDVVANCDYVGPGYGFPGESTLEAIDIFARLEGILLDPVYSGKAALIMLKDLKNIQKKRKQHVLFIHTGGLLGFYDKIKQLNKVVGKR